MKKIMLSVAVTVWAALLSQAQQSIQTASEEKKIESERSPLCQKHTLLIQRSSGEKW
jgi:hypothetical protein